MRSTAAPSSIAWAIGESRTPNAAKSRSEVISSRTLGAEKAGPRWLAIARMLGA